ncbi:class I SAM-dependent DNA methyltransferase [Actinopolyspora mortivallis]|uniref:class I SAM-dependent DNA methyltransferase n=1 Tax=Actinopolyspora mortivallis TaxID=33906 RepID=UPI000A041B2D|nr:class I SAM-dependent methyltransferase [Actinopolyspora mortivallis]
MSGKEWYSDGDLTSSAQFYDAFAEAYSSYMDQHAGYIESVEDEIVGIAAERNGVAILDIGTGTGERFDRLTSRIGPKRAVAVDESSEMTALAQRNCPGAEVVAVSLTDPLMKDSVKGLFNIVTCLSNVLGHVPAEEIVQSLRQVRELLEPDGILIFDVNNRYNVAHYGIIPVCRNKIKDMFSSRGGDFVTSCTSGGRVFRTSVHLFNRSEVAGLLRRSGFELKEITFRDYMTGKKRGEYGGSMVVKAVVK